MSKRTITLQFSDVPDLDIEIDENLWAQACALAENKGETIDAMGSRILENWFESRRA